MISLPPLHVQTDTSLSIQHGDLRARWTMRPVEGDDPEPLIETCPAGSLVLASIRSPAVRGQVDATAHGGLGFQSLVFNTAGCQRLHHGRREWLAEPGDVLLWSSHGSGDFEVSSAMEELQILVPIEAFARQWPLLTTDASPRCLRGDDLIVAMAQAALRTVWQQRRRCAEEDLQAAVAAVITLLAESAQRTLVSSASARPLFESLQHSIEQSLADPGLTPLRLAEVHGCSVRTVHAMFARHQLTVAGEIRRRRLERCRLRLADRHYTGPIGGLALEWGFNDAAHFSRLFREAYGMSPRAYRLNGVGAPSA